MFDCEVNKVLSAPWPLQVVSLKHEPRTYRSRVNVLSTWRRYANIRPPVARSQCQRMARDPPPVNFVVSTNMTDLYSGGSKDVPLPSCRRQREKEKSSYSFLTSALHGSEWSASRPGLERTTGTHWVGGCVGPRDGLDTEARGQILCACWESSAGRPVCSQTLH
jgi:hypothetical protein